MESGADYELDHMAMNKNSTQRDDDDQQLHVLYMVLRANMSKIKKFIKKM
jgi:hypothetical protein